VAAENVSASAGDAVNRFVVALAEFAETLLQDPSGGGLPPQADDASLARDARKSALNPLLQKSHV
jgi:hypothetical protein